MTRETVVDVLVVGVAAARSGIGPEPVMGTARAWTNDGCGAMRPRWILAAAGGALVRPQGLPDTGGLGGCRRAPAAAAHRLSPGEGTRTRAPSKCRRVVGRTRCPAAMSTAPERPGAGNRELECEPVPLLDRSSLRLRDFPRGRFPRNRDTELDSRPSRVGGSTLDHGPAL